MSNEELQENLRAKFRQLIMGQTPEYARMTIDKFLKLAKSQGYDTVTFSKVMEELWSEIMGAVVLGVNDGNQTT